MSGGDDGVAAAAVGVIKRVAVIPERLRVGKQVGVFHPGGEGDGSPLAAGLGIGAVIAVLQAVNGVFGDNRADDALAALCVDDLRRAFLLITADGDGAHIAVRAGHLHRGGRQNIGNFHRLVLVGIKRQARDRIKRLRIRRGVCRELAEVLGRFIRAFSKFRREVGDTTVAVDTRLAAFARRAVAFRRLLALRKQIHRARRVALTASRRIIGLHPRPYLFCQLAAFCLESGLVRHPAAHLGKQIFQSGRHLRFSVVPVTIVRDMAVGTTCLDVEFVGKVFAAHPFLLRFFHRVAAHAKFSGTGCAHAPMCGIQCRRTKQRSGEQEAEDFPLTKRVFLWIYGLPQVRLL